MSWFDSFRHICRPEAPLSELTWYRLGGAARWLFEPRAAEELAALLERIRGAGVAWRVLGRGANVLVGDAGFDGAVIRLTADFERTTFDGTRVLAGAGADFSRVIRDSIEHGLVGLEALAGIPASVGGAVRMNAGGRYGELGTFVASIQVLDSAGKLETWPASRAGFRYRGTTLDGCVVLAAELQLAEGNRDAARRRYREIWLEKSAEQPAVSVRSAGCVFKNPEGGKAGRLIDETGLKGLRVGGAEVSTRHANFIVVHEGGRAQDVLDLIELVRERVARRTGVELQLELDVWRS